MKPTAALLIACLLPVVAVASGPVLSATAYGRIKFGTRLDRIEKLLDEKIPVADDPDETSCRQVVFKTYPGVTFMVEESVITRAESSKRIATSIGLTVGDSMKAVMKRYPSIAIEPHEYRSDGHYLVLKNSAGNAAILMEETRGVVTDIRGGLMPSVEYVEGCL